MKAILMSIKPKWIAKILNGEKTIEIRKRFPSNYRGWVYIYATKAGLLWKEDKWFGCGVRGYNPRYSLAGKVVARFWCDKVEEIDSWYHLDKENFAKTCLTLGEFLHYLGDKNGYAIHISMLEIFDKPMELSEFEYYNPQPYQMRAYPFFDYKLTKAPQSWCYLYLDEDII